MTMMSLWLSRLCTGRESLSQIRDVLAKAKAGGGAYMPSAQEQKDVLAVLTPLANAVNDRFIFSHRVNAAELAALLREQHRDGWAECRDAVTEAEARISSNNGPLDSGDVLALRLVADALDEQCANLWARTGGY